MASVPFLRKIAILVLTVLGGIAKGDSDQQPKQTLLASKVQAPDPGSFNDYVRRKMPELTAKSATRPDELLWLPLDSRNTLIPNIDQTTGLVPPIFPFGHLMEVLPESEPKAREYEKQIRTFLQRRDQLSQLRKQYDQLLGEHDRLNLLSGPLSIAPDYFAKKILAWNGEIFWAPASKSDDYNLRFGDEARAVFGPIPAFDVTTLGKTTRSDGSSVVTASLYAEVDGNRIELKPNPNKQGNPLEYEHTDADGNVVKWTATVDKCDKPSLAGGVTPCGTASRLSRVVRGNVEWIALARKTKKDPAPLDNDPYWQQGNPAFKLLGYIGFNKTSGEVVFFDGTYSGMKLDWKSAIVAPGGKGYSDEEGRTLAANIYDDAFRSDCIGCHDNKEPRIITPYIKQARVGYRETRLAKAFSLGDLLPNATRSRRAPYRVVGSSYTALHTRTISTTRTVMDPAQNCTSCHPLTSGNTARFASDAVGRLGSLIDDKGEENAFRTAWALRSGAGKIHPWMVAGDGNDLSADPPVPEISDADWNKLKAVLEDPSKDPQSLDLCTETPAPESFVNDKTRIADPSGPQNFTLEIADNRDGTGEVAAKEIHVLWQYLNDFGGVPDRDDVRFHLAIRETAIPNGGAEPRDLDYPSIEQTIARISTDLGGGVYLNRQDYILKDVSFIGHRKFTDPAPSSTLRSYRIDFPVITGKRYLIRVLAKRFGFDQGGERYSYVDHLYYVDVR
jgi:hypothetical protein